MTEREGFCLLTCLMSLLDKIKSQQIHVNLPNYFELELVQEVHDPDCPSSQQAAHTSSRRARPGEQVCDPPALLSPHLSQGLTSPALRPLSAAYLVPPTLARKAGHI